MFRKGSREKKKKAGASAEKADAKTTARLSHGKGTGKGTASSGSPRPAASQGASANGKSRSKGRPMSAPVKVPFPRKQQPPTETEFAARLPAAVGKKFEAVRSYMKKQKGVAEDLYFYGPKTGWAFRYLRGKQSLATIMIHDDRLMGIVALDAAAFAAVDFSSMSEVGQRARKVAHGTPSLLWLDLPLDGSGASDFKALLKAKVKAKAPRPVGPPSPPPPRPSSR